MRIKREFGKRYDLPRETKQIVFLVFEGERTEVIYFNGIRDYQNRLGMNEEIKLIQVYRSVNEKGWSNPQKILDRLLLDLSNTVKDGITLKMYLNRLMDYLTLELLEDEGIISAKELCDVIAGKLQEQYRISEESMITSLKKVIKTTAKIINKELSLHVMPQKIHEYFRDSEITFDPDCDRVCLVVDRDRYSFIERQFKYVLKTCSENNIEFYLSNPCFEFWLLLHFEEVLKIDRKKFYDNKKTDHKTYAEAELLKLYPGYRKSKYDFELFLPRVELAILQAHYFCEEITKLKNQVGSNLGFLLSSFKK